ncbi:uncharacterized protein LOC119611780 [Lucilia sericata]|uniref:uncharacterized protein LOC119611780 n=1 Tax=Lucilia sericata TaxID=13632 RepID=UPI0018A82538|nr:uncharacterized protein LOC119611780 [Lucilia sericata]
MFCLKEYRKNCCICSNNFKLCSVKSVYLVLTLLLIQVFKVSLAQPYRNTQRCSHRLENALEHMRRRSIQTKSSRSYVPQTPYSLYHSLYGQPEEPEEDFYHPSNDRGYYAKNINRNYNQPYSRLDFEAALSQTQNQYQNQRQPHRLAVARVDVEDLKVRLPNENAARWVEVDKCKFSSENSTLDTRLIFPDLTLSGKVVLQPAGGKCNMILRLRHAGIEFRTIPIGFEKISGEESRRIGAASVRTDSHFAEPGFISVFAHGCQGPTGIKVRQNSKRRYSFVDEQQPSAAAQTPLPPEVLFDIRSEGYIPPNMRDQELEWTDSSSQEFYDPNGDNFYRQKFRFKRSNPYRQGRQTVNPERFNDEMNFDDDVLNVADDKLQDMMQPDARAFADIFSANTGTGGNMFNDHEEVNDAMRNELEKLFSMGVRGLLTTYMQRALQPAIKETLMENMGYTISYG